MGLVDDLATDKVDAIAKCENFLNQFKKISPVAREITKQTLRSKEIQELEENRLKDFEFFSSNVIHPTAQETIGTFLQELKNKKRGWNKKSIFKSRKWVFEEIMWKFKCLEPVPSIQKRDEI